MSLRSGSGKSAVTLGKFDGIHIGHIKLIRNIVQYARQADLVSMVFSIEMNDGSILSHEERARFLETLGVDCLVEYPFSKSFMHMTPEEFVRTILSKTLHAEYAAVGTDFAFGHNREGDASTLKMLGGKYGYTTKILEKEQIRGEDVSSTRVRQALKEADLELVSELLGRPYPVFGTVKHGRRIGTGIGIPTVNLIPEEGKILPPDGVYSSITKLPDGMTRKGLTNIGTQPTVGGTTRRIETTLIDHESDLYGAAITHHLLRHIRPIKAFSGLDELKEQIRKDRKTAWG